MPSPRAPWLQDGVAPEVLTAGAYVLDDTQSIAHAIGTALLLEEEVDAEGWLAWWVWGRAAVCPAWGMVVEVGIN